jgi:multicomponent Na+:H+ antiporter subunit F
VTLVIFVSIAGVLAAMAMLLGRALVGPTLHDRVLAINSFGTMAVLLIALHGFFAGRPDFLDVALTYALVSFVGTLGVLKFLSWRDLGAVDAPEREA